MAHTVVITSPVALTSRETEGIARALDLSAQDQITYTVDPLVIAGLRVTIDGKTIDLTTKRKLEEIEK